MLAEIGCSHVPGHPNNRAREWGSVYRMSLCRMSLESLESPRNTGRSDHPLASRTARPGCSPYFSIVPNFFLFVCVCVVVLFVCGSFVCL